jgi:hypothetical protein
VWIAGRGRRRPAIGGGGATGGIWSLVGDSMKRSPGGPAVTLRLPAPHCGSMRQPGGSKGVARVSPGGEA